MQALQPGARGPSSALVFHVLMLRSDAVLLLSCPQHRARLMGMKHCMVLLAALSLALPKPAECNPAVNSKGMISPRGTVEMVDNVCPMTVSQKGELFLRHTYSPINLMAAAGSAGIWQATQTRS